MKKEKSARPEGHGKNKDERFKSVPDPDDESDEASGDDEDYDD